ncbi:MAG: leucine-rich repeat domain-containing protein [Bacillota bacterium]
MKKGISLLLVVSLVLSIAMIGNTSVLAQQSGDFTYIITDSAATITKYTGAGGTVTIPSSIEGFSVSTISWGAFDGCTGLIGVNIPNSVTTIGLGAFSNCTGLTKVTLPYSVNTIVGNAFSGCDKLTQINVAVNNSTYSSEDGVLFDKGKTKIIIFPAGKTGDYLIPKSVKSIDNSAFQTNKVLTSLSFSYGVSSIGMNAFNGCIGLGYLIIPGSVTSIGESAFLGCTSLGSVIFDGNAPIMGDGAFYKCASGFVVYYRSTMKGFSNPWYGYRALMMPGPTTINKVTNTDKSISGKGTTGGVATVIIGTKIYTTKVVKGTWKVTLKNTFVAGTYVSASVILNSYLSYAAPTNVIPAAPTVNTIKVNSIYVKGTATKASTVFAKIGTKIYSSKASTKSGTFSIKIPKIKKGTSVAVYCKSGGQTSDKKTVKAV